MKKLNVLFLALGLVFLLNSCSKTEEYQNVALAQTIDQNQSFTFELPITDDPYKVTTEAKNASISLIGVSATGNPIYTYTPSIDFVGADQIVLTTYHNNSQATRGAHPQDFVNNLRKSNIACVKESAETEDDYIVTINITILPVVPTL